MGQLEEIHTDTPKGGINKKQSNFFNIDVKGSRKSSDDDSNAKPTKQTHPSQEFEIVDVEEIAEDGSKRIVRKKMPMTMMPLLQVPPAKSSQ